MKTKKSKTYQVKAKIWLYPGENASWHFVSIPKKESSDIKKEFEGYTRGWGSLRVSVTIGKTTWNTSVFPDSKSGTYILPLKADIRKKEGLFLDDVVKVVLTIVI